MRRWKLTLKVVCEGNLYSGFRFFSERTDACVALEALENFFFNSNCTWECSEERDDFTTKGSDLLTWFVLEPSSMCNLTKGLPKEVAEKYNVKSWQGFAKKFNVEGWIEEVKDKTEGVNILCGLGKEHALYNKVWLPN
jgi:hypothetical protein